MNHFFRMLTGLVIYILGSAVAFCVTILLTASNEVIKERIFKEVVAFLVLELIFAGIAFILFALILKLEEKLSPKYRESKLVWINPYILYCLIVTIHFFLNSNFGLNIQVNFFFISGIIAMLLIPYTRKIVFLKNVAA